MCDGGERESAASATPEIENEFVADNVDTEAHNKKKSFIEKHYLYLLITPTTYLSIILFENINYYILMFYLFLNMHFMSYEIQ